MDAPNLTKLRTILAYAMTPGLLPLILLPRLPHQSLKKSKTNCWQCGKDLEQGKAGRRCVECRKLPEPQQQTVEFESELMAG